MSMGALEDRADGMRPPAPQRIEARLMPWAAGLGVVSWAFALLVGLVVFYFGLVMGSIVPWLALPITVLGILAALFCGWRLWCAMGVRKADAPVLTIGPEGFHDTRIGQLIPWREIESLTPDQPGTRTFLRIAAREPRRFVGRRVRLPRDGVLVSSLSELDVAPDALIVAARAHLTAA